MKERSQNRRRYKALILAAMLLLLTGCSAFSRFGTNEDIYKPKPSSAPEIPVEGGMLNLYITKPDTLDPLYSTNSYVQDYSDMIFDPLFEVDSKLQAQPVLVDRYDVSEDMLTWTFWLKSGIKWHDGSDLTASDVVYTFNLIKTGRVTSVFQRNTMGIFEVKAVDDTKFTVKLLSRDYFLPTMLTFPIEKKDYADNALNPIGTGPFKLESRSDTLIRLARNDYRKNDGSGPYFNNVNLKIYDPAKTFQKDALSKKEIDAAVITDGDYNRYMSAFGFSRKLYISDRFEFLVFNLKRPNLSNKQVRHAVAAAIDQVKLVDTVLPGKAVVSDLPLTPGSIYNFSNDLALEAGTESARQMMRDAGYTEQNGIFRYGTGPLTFEILINDGNPIRLAEARYIEARLRKAGIEAYIRNVDFQTYISMIAAGTYDLAISGLKTVGSAPDNLNMYNSAFRTRPEGATEANEVFNTAGYQNQEIDNLLAGIHNIKDSSEAENYFWRIKSIINDDLPYLGLFYYMDALAFTKNVKGDIRPDAWGQFKNTFDWYMGGQ